jgi:hypothetical protein
LQVRRRALRTPPPIAIVAAHRFVIEVLGELRVVQIEFSVQAP